MPDRLQIVRKHTAGSRLLSIYAIVKFLAAQKLSSQPLLHQSAAWRLKMGKEEKFVLKTEKLTKVYDKKRAVNEVSIHVKQGDIYGFIGKNGAGKTTLMRMVSGLARPNAGTIELFGQTDIENQRARIGTLIESPGLYRGMSARENLEVVRRAYGIPDKSIVEHTLSFVGLADTGKKKAGNFSMGMKQRLGIAIALLRSPDFLILDEPINGLDPQGIKQMRELLVKLNREKNITIMISSHILGELSKIATAYGIIRDGALAEEFDATELSKRCRRCQRLAVDNTEQAVHILEEELHIEEFDVPESGIIRIYEQLEQSSNINRRLILAGINIRESYLAGQDLESYFMNLVENGTTLKK